MVLVSLGGVFASGALAAPTQRIIPTLVASLPGGTGLSLPNTHLVQGSDGNFYGAAKNRNSGNAGGVFRISQTGSYTDFYDFDPSLKLQALGGVMQATNGQLYGMLVSNGAASNGAIYSLALGGQFSTVHNFGATTQSGFNVINADGSLPVANLTQTPDGTLYGVALFGGASGDGTIFSVSPTGTFSLLYTFGSSSAVTGVAPNGTLVVGSDGNLYGTTRNGGTNDQGIIYRVTPGGEVTQLFSFPTPGASVGCGSGEAVSNNGSLTAGPNGVLFGALCMGGSNGTGVLYSFNPSTLTFTVLHDFPAGMNGNVGGAGPNGPLVLGVDGNLYGTTGSGGANGNGIIFVMGQDGSFKTLYDFSATGAADGRYPYALMLGSDSYLYGTTITGGANNAGAVFKVPFLPMNDIVLTNKSTGKLDVRLINRLGAQQVLETVASGYYPVAVADFDGDGVPDILWTSAKNDLYMWLGGKVGATGFKAVYVGTYPAGWSVTGAGDIDGDGEADLYWIDPSTHQFGYWLMNGASIKSTYATTYAPGYYPIAEGDFDGDGKLDVLWSSANNDLYIWYSNGASIGQHFNAAYAGTYPSGWKVVGAADMDGDGKSDLVWMKTDGTQWGYWLMNGAQRKATVAVSNAGAANTFIVGVDDYNNDGLADLVWSNGSNLILSTNAGTCASQCTFTTTTLAAPAADTTVFRKNIPSSP